MRTSSIVSAIFAVLLAALAAFGASLWWRVIHSPGDDNPIAGLGLLVALVAGSLALALGVLAARLRRR
jgi:uncharacterized membrane protein